MDVIVHHPSEPDSGSHPELTNLAESYAIRIRELSDAVATLGRRIAAREQIEENIREVKRLKTLADQAGEELFGVLESPKLQVSAT